MRALRFFIAVPIVIAMIGFAKLVQYASVEAFGASLGFDLASLVGVAPLIVVYFVAAAKLPDPFKGKARG